MSPHLYHRLTRERLARLRRHPGAPVSHARVAHTVSVLALNTTTTQEVER